MYLIVAKYLDIFDPPPAGEQVEIIVVDIAKVGLTPANHSNKDHVDTILSNAIVGSNSLQTDSVS
jgi:hypothetical protein